MKFYLQTLNANDFMEVNQSISLAGVFTDPIDFTRKEINVNESLSALLEVMSEDQTVLVHGISNGFRHMLEEARDVQNFSNQVHLIVPADGQGYMTLKAGFQREIPVACGRVFTLEQAAIAMHNHASQIVLDLERISCYADPKEVLEEVLDHALALDNLDCVLVVCQSLTQYRMAMTAGATAISAPKAVYDQALYSILTAAQVAQARDEWILTYTRNEALDMEEILLNANKQDNEEE